MSRRGSGSKHRSPLLRTLFLILIMSGIALVLYVPLFLLMNSRRNDDLAITLLLAVSALLPTFGASRFTRIPKRNAKEYILSALIAVFSHGALSFALMAACSLLLDVENLAQVILLTVAWIPAILVATVLPLIRAARERRLSKRELRMVDATISHHRATAVAILGGILFSTWMHILNGLLLLIAEADSGSVLAGIIFPLVWSLFAVYRPRTPHLRAYRLSAILTGAVCSVATYAFAVILYQNSFSMTQYGNSIFTLTFRAPLTSPAIPLAIATLTMTTILPLWVKPASEETEIDRLG